MPIGVPLLETAEAPTKPFGPASDTYSGPNLPKGQGGVSEIRLKIYLSDYSL